MSSADDKRPADEESAADKRQREKVEQLLLRAPEIRKLTQEVETAGRQIVALRMYFKEALVKVEIATATGKKQFDKREDLKKREQNLEARRALQSRR